MKPGRVHCHQKKTKNLGPKQDVWKIYFFDYVKINLKIKYHLHGNNLPLYISSIKAWQSAT